MSSGVIRDFAGPYYVGEGEMAFGKPTRYLQLTPTKAMGGERGWDDGVIQVGGPVIKPLIKSHQIQKQC